MSEKLIVVSVHRRIEFFTRVIRAQSSQVESKAKLEVKEDPVERLETPLWQRDVN